MFRKVFFNMPTVLPYYRRAPHAALGRWVLAIGYFHLRSVPPSHCRSAQLC